MGAHRKHRLRRSMDVQLDFLHAHQRTYFRFIGAAIAIVVCILGCIATTAAHKPLLRIFYVCLCLTLLTDTVIGIGRRARDLRAK